MIPSRVSLALGAAQRFSASRSTTAPRSLSTFTRSYPSSQASASAARKQQPTFFQQSFHPSTVAVSIDTGSTQQRRWASLLAVAALAGIVTAYKLASPVHLDAAPSASGPTSLVADPSTQVVVDPDTQLSFPLYIPTPTSLDSPSRLRLVGLGVRTVSFLSVRVYVAALYIDDSHASPERSGKTLEAHMKDLIDSGVPVVIRIVPVRNTDFNHLRDGFIRALQARLKKAIKSGVVQQDSEVEAQFQQAIGQVKESFPRGSVPKGSPLDLVVKPVNRGERPTRASLSFEYAGEVFGQVKADKVGSERGEDEGFTVGRELVLAYFADKDEISGKFKKSVQQGLLGQ